MMTTGPYTCALCGAPMAGGYVVDGTLSCLTCWLTGRGPHILEPAHCSESEVRNAARRAIRKRLKSRFFHAWSRPGYETLDHFLSGVRARLAPTWLRDPGDQNPDDPEVVPRGAHVVRAFEQDIEGLLGLVDDCLCYIAHLEETREGDTVPHDHPATEQETASG